MGTIHVSKKAGAHVNNTGYPGTVDGGDVFADGAVVDGGSPTTITVPFNWGSAAPGDILRWTVSGQPSELRRIIDISGRNVTVNAPVTAGNGTVIVGGDLPTIQAGLDAVAALVASGLNSEAWTVEVAAGVYAEMADIGVSGAFGIIHTLRLADGAVMDGEMSRDFCLTSDQLMLYWRIVGGMFRRALNQGINLPKLHVLAEDCEVCECGTGVHLGQYGIFHNLLVHDNSGAGVILGNYALVSNVRSYDNAAEQFLSSALGTKFTRCQGRAPAGSQQPVFALSSQNPITLDRCVAHGGPVGFDCSSSSGAGAMNTLGCIAYQCGIGFRDSQDRGSLALRSNNLLYGCTTNYQNYATDEGEILDDPMFVDPDGSPPDYSLRPGSPIGPVGGATGTVGEYGVHGLRRR